MGATKTQQAEKGYSIEDGSYWLSGTADPAATSLAAPICSHYWRNNSNTAEVWRKTGVADNAWTLIFSGVSSIEEGHIRNFIGKNAVGSETPNYSARSAGAGQQIGNTDDEELAIAKIDDKIGTNLTPESRTNNPTLAANEVHQNISANDKAIGDDADVTNINYISVNSTAFKKSSDLDGQVKSNADNISTLLGGTGNWKEFSVCITDDASMNAASNGTALSTLLSFSDDDVPALAIGDFSDGDYILSRNNSGTCKLYKVYDDAGTLKVTVSGVTQPAEGSMYGCRYDLIESPNSKENGAGYLLTNGNLNRVFSFNWALATGIALSTGYTPASGNPAVADTVEAAIQKIDGNVDNVNSQVGRGQSDTHMGTYTGDLLNDNESAKQNIQQLEARCEELGKELTGTLSSGSLQTVDTIALSGTHRYKWEIMTWETATPANAYGCDISCMANTGGNSNPTRDNIDVIGTEYSFAFTLSVVSNNLILKINPGVAINYKITRIKRG